MARFLVYALIDPRTGVCLYVGKSCSGMARPRGHTRPSLIREKTRKNSWIKSLQAQGLGYGIEVVEELAAPEGLADAERFYIAALRAAGAELLNETEGGEGALGRIGGRAARGYRHSAEAKAKIGAAARGRRATEQSLRRRSLAHTGRGHTEATKQKLSRLKAGTKHTPETRAQMATSQRVAWDRRRSRKS